MLSEFGFVTMEERLCAEPGAEGGVVCVPASPKQHSEGRSQQRNVEVHCVAHLASLWCCRDVLVHISVHRAKAG